MSKALERLGKLADLFEQKLKKTAQETTDVYTFQKWLDENFTTADKNKIANNVANSIDDDLNSFYVNLSVNKGKLNTDATVNSAPNDAARKAVNNVVLPKISSVLSKFPDGSKYIGWIKYPK